jgi:hypothetical protein
VRRGGLRPTIRWVAVPERRRVDGVSGWRLNGMGEDGRSSYIELLSSGCEKFSLETAIILLSISVSTSINVQQRPESPKKYLTGTYGHSVV